MPTDPSVKSRHRLARDGDYAAHFAQSRGRLPVVPSEFKNPSDARTFSASPRSLTSAIISAAEERVARQFLEQWRNRKVARRCVHSASCLRHSKNADARHFQQGFPATRRKSRRSRQVRGFPFDVGNTKHRASEDQRTETPLLLASEKKNPWLSSDNPVRTPVPPLRHAGQSRFKFLFDSWSIRPSFPAGLRRGVAAMQSLSLPQHHSRVASH